MQFLVFQRYRTGEAHIDVVRPVQLQLLLQNVLAVTDLGKTSIYFRFSPAGSASVQLDDVYVDPIFHE